MFWTDPRVLFSSVHRHEFAKHDDGCYTRVGEGPGAGYNINVPWEKNAAPCGDADYFAVWDHILVPVATGYNPDMIIVSAGFDAAVGDPLGRCCVTPYGYSSMLKKLMNLAQGKLVLALDGGYNLESMATSTLACAQFLLDGTTINNESSETYPFESTWRVIRAVRRKLSSFWPILSDELPDDLISKNVPFSELSSFRPILSDELPDDLISKNVPFSGVSYRDSDDEAAISAGLKSLELHSVKEDGQGQVFATLCRLGPKFG